MRTLTGPPCLSLPPSRSVSAKSFPARQSQIFNIPCLSLVARYSPSVLHLHPITLDLCFVIFPVESEALVSYNLTSPLASPEVSTEPFQAIAPTSPRYGSCQEPIRFFEVTSQYDMEPARVPTASIVGVCLDQSKEIGSPWSSSNEHICVIALVSSSW